MVLTSYCNPVLLSYCVHNQVELTQMFLQFSHSIIQSIHSQIPFLIYVSDVDSDST